MRLSCETLEARWALAAGSELAPDHVTTTLDDHHDHGDGSYLTASRGTPAPIARANGLPPKLTGAAVRRTGLGRSATDGRLARLQAVPAPAASPAPPARGDFNGDGTVGRGDIAILAANLGKAAGATFAEGDLTTDGIVNLFDLAGIVFSVPGLQITKSASVTNVDLAGDMIGYTYTVENTGNMSLTGVVVTDDRSLPLTRLADAPGDGDNVLEYGEIWKFSATYTVVASDLASGADFSTSATAASDQTEPATSAVTVQNLFQLPQITLGDVTIQPVNHASFVMTWNGRTVYVDPVGGAALYASFPRADVILVSHTHGDHWNATTITGVMDAETRILAPQAVFNAMSTALRNITTVLANNATTTLQGFSITAVPAYDTATSNHPQGVGNGYVVSLAGVPESQRVYASGDTGAMPEVRALDDIDIALVCMNTPFTMSVPIAASVVRDIAPGTIIPYHYRNGGTPVTFADLSQFKTLIAADLPIQVRLLDWY